MKTIVCNFNLFDTHQKVLIYDEDGKFQQVVGMATLDKLNSLILAVCQQYDTGKVHLFGDTVYADKISREILENAEKIYGLNPIEIEVN